MLAEEKDALYNKIVSLVAAVPDKEILLTSGDLNGHVGEHSAGCQGCQGFDCVPRNVLWWAIQKFGIDEWIIQTVRECPFESQNYQLLQ